MTDNNEDFTSEQKIALDQLLDRAKSTQRTQSKYKLQDLLKDFDPDKHRIPEIDWGPPVGREIL